MKTINPMIIAKETIDAAIHLKTYGMAAIDVRCLCGNKLMETETAGESIVRIKCRRCGKIVKAKV